MADKTLRRLERRWTQLGTLKSGCEYLQALVRTGVPYSRRAPVEREVERIRRHLKLIDTGCDACRGWRSPTHHDWQVTCDGCGRTFSWGGCSCDGCCGDGAYGMYGGGQERFTVGT